MVRVNKSFIPGAFICDLIPILKYAPPWFPFHREAKIGKALVDEVVARPYNHVRHEMAAGTARPSLTQDLLSKEVDPEDAAQLEHRIKWTTGAMYGAGSETMFATVTGSILAMTLYPEKQRLAQAEIDEVLGADRLPSVIDRPKLPYVNAFIKEVMRWHPVVPLSIARRTAEDDEYEGYFIPKSTVVIPNIWAIAFAPNETYDPYAFIPERFLDPAHPTTDPNSWAFGFSRRICPGKALAEDAVFILITTILAVFKVSPRPGVEVKAEFSPHLVSHPESFDCLIEPRSDGRAALIRAAAAQSTI